MSEFRATQNKWLTVAPGVILTDIIDPVIVGLDQFFEVAKLKATVTSGLRTDVDQLRIIRNYSRHAGVDVEFPEILTCGVQDKTQYEGEEVYAWQPAWSRLLNKGIIVNPPLTARVLFDYRKTPTSPNRKGQFIGPSAHFNGTAFDISGGDDGNTGNEEAVISAALRLGGVPGAVGYLTERKNNCIHIDCRPIDETTSV